MKFDNFPMGIILYIKYIKQVFIEFILKYKGGEIFK